MAGDGGVGRAGQAVETIGDFLELAERVGEGAPETREGVFGCGDRRASETLAVEFLGGGRYRLLIKYL